MFTLPLAVLLVCVLYSVYRGTDVKQVELHGTVGISSARLPY